MRISELIDLLELYDPDTEINIDFSATEENETLMKITAKIFPPYDEGDPNWNIDDDSFDYS